MKKTYEKPAMGIVELAGSLMFSSASVGNNANQGSFQKEEEFDVDETTTSSDAKLWGNDVWGGD